MCCVLNTHFRALITQCKKFFTVEIMIVGVWNVRLTVSYSSAQRLHGYTLGVQQCYFPLFRNSQFPPETSLLNFFFLIMFANRIKNIMKFGDKTRSFSLVQKPPVSRRPVAW